MRVFIIKKYVIHEGSHIESIFLDEDKAKKSLAKYEKNRHIDESAYRSEVWFDMDSYEVEE